MDHYNDYPELLKQAKAERDRLAAEIARRDRYEGCDGCSTGDCPHGLIHECVQAQAEIIREQEAFVTRQSAELHDAEAKADRLAAIVERLTKACKMALEVMNHSEMRVRSHWQNVTREAIAAAESAKENADAD